MFSEFKSLVIWGIFWSLTFVVLIVDTKRARAKAEADGTSSFTDRSIRSYALMACLIGGLALVVYFYATRRNGRGGLVGIAALIGVSLVTLLLGSGYGVAARWIDHSQAVHACQTFSDSDPDGQRCSRGAYQFKAERTALLQAGCDSGQIEPCLYLEETLSFAGLLGDRNSAEESVSRKRARELCAKRPATVRRGRCDVFDGR